MNDTIQRLARFIRDNPSDLFSRFALALEMVKLGEVGKARALFESILDVQPEYSGLAYHLGKLYQRIGEIESAEKLFLDGIRVATEKGDNHSKSELIQALEDLNALKSE